MTQDSLKVSWNSNRYVDHGHVDEPENIASHEYRSVILTPIQPKTHKYMLGKPNEVIYKK